MYYLFNFLLTNHGFMFIIIAIFTGLIVNYFTSGLAFSSLLCAIAGLFLIMPSLLNLKISDFNKIIEFKKIVIVNIFLNFIFIPFIFYFFSSLFLNDIYYLKYAFLLLGIMSSGGLVLSWVMKNEGDTKLAFILFMINFLFFIFLFFPLNSFFQSEALNGTKLIDSLKVSSLLINKDPTVETCIFQNVLPSCFSKLGANTSPIIAFFSIIFIPFIISRIILLFPKIENIIKKRIKTISAISTFLIVAYIFSLKQIRQIYEFDLNLIIKILFILFVVYLLVYIVSFSIYKLIFNSKEGIALFWVSSTRYLTLGLIFSFIYSVSFGYAFLLVFVLAYFVQILLSITFSYLINYFNKAKI